MLAAPAGTCSRLLEPSPFAGGDRARLYLVDLPGGSTRVLVIAVAADDDSFQTVLEWATPVVASIEIHTP